MALLVPQCQFVVCTQFYIISCCLDFRLGLRWTSMLSYTIYFLQQNKNCCHHQQTQLCHFIIMQAENPELPISLSEIKKRFQIPILKLKPNLHLPSNFYGAITSYGNMCLAVEKFESINKIITEGQWIAKRNQIICNNPQCFPLIFQQHVFQKSGCTICLTLIQDCSSLYHILNQGIEIKLLSFAKLVKSLSLIQQKGLNISSLISATSLLYLNNSEEISLDFTKISNVQVIYSNSSPLFLQSLLEFMKGLLMVRYNSDEEINQIIFIQGKIYTFLPCGLTQASDYTELLILMNACIEMEVNLILRAAIKSSQQEDSPVKVRKIKIRSLSGNPLIQISGKRYHKLTFQDGKCMNCLREVSSKQLSTKFIHENSLYKLQQFEHLVVHTLKNFGQARKQEIITVYPPVSKVELISFLIAYINCVDPLMKKIEYLPLENSLKLTYVNRRKQDKVLTMVFYEDYTVKDQQISMILEKSNLLQCKLDLREMKISDGFLIFLSHNQKAKQIKQLYLTDSYGLSDIGLSTYLRSPSSQNLEALSLSAVNPQNSILQESLELIGTKQSLKRLNLRKISLNSSTFGDEIDLSKLSLTQLQCRGIKISLVSVIKSSLKILKIDQLVPIEELKNLKHLKLTQLKIRLIQGSKKTLIQSFSSFNPFLNNKNKEFQIFAEGESKATLKKLDISYSNCKFKTLRPLLMMAQLEQINLAGCINLGTEFDYISPKILMASFAETDIDVQQMKTILKNNQEMVQLNIMNTKLTKHEIIKLIVPTKMYINNLILSETQFTNKLLDYSNGYELIQCIELYIDRLLQPEQQYSFNLLIQKASASSKTIRFIFSLDDNGSREFIQEKKQLLISRINKYLIMNATRLQSLQNLYLNKLRITEILEIQDNFQVEDSCESTVASSIAISTDRCRIISTPKVIFRRSHSVPILFKVLQRQTIDKFTHRFAKFMQKNNKFVSVDLSGNKLIGKQVINMIRQYGRDLVREIDIRDCMFQLNQVIDTVFEFNNLNSLNQGEVSVKLTRQNFVNRSQKYLKFFMRVKKINTLKIECEQIEQLQILFSVLSHVLDQCYSSLNSLTIHLTQITFNKESYHFLNTIFRESDLREFDFRLSECRIIDRQCSYIWYKGITHMKNLQKVTLFLPAFDFPQINMFNLADADLQFTDGQAEEVYANKCLRNLSVSKNLKNLRISFSNCSKISNLNRLFGSLPVGNLFERLTNLQHLTLNFEYCQLKQPTLYELLGYLIKLQKLRMLQLNVSFAISHFPDFVSYIQKMADQLIKPMGIKIICVTEKSNTYLLRTESLVQKGIIFVL